MQRKNILRGNVDAYIEFCIYKILGNFGFGKSDPIYLPVLKKSKVRTGRTARDDFMLGKAKGLTALSFPVISAGTSG